MIKRLLFLMVTAAILMGAGEYLYMSSGTTGINSVSVSFVETGDTVQASKFTPAFGIDSFVYNDTFSYWNATDSTDTTAHKTVSWTSPSQKVRINIVWDTTKTYFCSLDCGTNIYGAQWVSDNDVTTAGQAIDSLVAIVNAVAGLTDTVVLEDSVSYIKVRSKIAQIGLEGDARWRIKCGPTNFLDTVAYGKVTVAMVCDSMVAKINAATGLLTYVTASDSTTYYKIVSDKAGLLYYNAVKTPDTTQDVAVIQANVRGSASGTGYLSLGDPLGFKSMTGQFVINPGLTACDGIGNSDTARIVLYSTFAGRRIPVDSAAKGSLPCTLFTTKHSNLGDTLIRGPFEVLWYVGDTMSETTATITYPFHWVIKMD